MSHPIVPQRTLDSTGPSVSPGILRRLSDNASHDFDVIGDAPPAKPQAREQPVEQPPPAK